MQQDDTQEHYQESSIDYLAKAYHFMLIGGLTYWAYTLIFKSLIEAANMKLAMMAIPYSIVGVALLFMALDAFRNKHYFYSLYFLSGLLIAGSMA